MRGCQTWVEDGTGTSCYQEVYPRRRLQSPLLRRGVGARGVRSRRSPGPGELYGVWWFNRRRTTTTQLAVAGSEGREYKKRSRVAYRDRDEWIAVPFPDLDPREWVDAARTVVAGYRSPSKLGGRFWELSGALMRCGECGRAMEPVDRYYKTKTGQKGVICYYRCREGNRRKDTCPDRKSVRSDYRTPPCGGSYRGCSPTPYVSRGHRRHDRGAARLLTRRPEREARAWLERLAALDCKRSGYLDLAAEGIMCRDELRSKLAELREAARRLNGN